MRVTAAAPLTALSACARRYFPNQVLDGCPRLWDIEASLQTNSCTVLLDTVTGELVR